MKINYYNLEEKPSNEKIDETFFHIENLQQWQEIANDIRQKFTNVFIFGVGGSSLAGQVLCQFNAKNFPKVKFIDVLDSESMEKIKTTNTGSTGFVFITKSGETLETIVQMNYCLELLQNHNFSLEEHCFAITMNGTPLWNFAKENEITTIIHPEISGRFSCFTAVTIFPALIAGVDVSAYIEGGKEQFGKSFNTAFSCEILKKPIHVIMPYVKKLNIFTEWYSQLMAETLSKNGNGYAILRCIGTKDQHNQLQMFLDGKADKTYTFIAPPSCNQNIVPNISGIAGIPQSRLCSVINSGMHGVAQCLAEQNKKVRVITFTEITPKEIGKLFMFFMQEALIQAEELGVEPFTQPAVASAKKQMYDFLK